MSERHSVTTFNLVFTHLWQVKIDLQAPSFGTVLYGPKYGLNALGVCGLLGAASFPIRDRMLEVYQVKGVR